MPATLQQVRTRIRKSNSGQAELLDRFADILYSKADPEFLDAFDGDSLFAMAVQGLAVLRRHRDDAVDVKVFNPNYQADGWESNYTVMQLCLDDRPFIVDSVRAELRRQGCELFHLLHPLISVVRDDQGNLLDLQDRTGKGRRLAFEMYFVERIDDEERCRRLQEGVRRILEDVVLATDDYQAMRKQACALRDYLQHLRQVSAQGYHRDRAEELEECAAFMDWLDEDNFVFLGYREYDIFTTGDTRYLQVTRGSGLGILRKVEDSAYNDPVPVEEIPEGLRERVTGGRVFIVTKANAEATVHRPARMDYIGIKKLSDSWQVLGEQRFLGLFTSKAHSTPVEETPILRRKLRQVLELDNAIPDSHDYKQIISIFNSMPREELFWSETIQLHNAIRTIMGLQQERGVRLTLRSDPLKRGLAVMVIMPRDRFNAEVRRRIQTLLGEKLEASHVDYQLAMGEDEAQVRFHFFFTTSRSQETLDVKALENEVADLTYTWEDELRERLLASEGDKAGRLLADRYLNAFDERYKADTTIGVALRDISNLEALGDAPYLVDMLNPVEDQQAEEATQLKIYHKNRTLVLSDVLPVLENLGFRVLEQVPYLANLAEGHRGIDVFRVQDLPGRALDVRRDRGRLIEALTELLPGKAENDRLNRLILYAGLTIRQVALLRSYQMYYAQLRAVTSRRFINDALLHNPRVAALLYSYFEVKFDPAWQGDRASRLDEIRQAFLDSLQRVASLSEDQALRGLMNLMEATVRTNFFLDREAISFKLASQRVASMPEPRPLFEIAVLGLGVEGAHLRGGRVARGGIRWSDRPDDFRTEILGLMKTQMAKNAVIVPVGSKGGFVLKNPPTDREALREYVEEQYRVFISALLDVTDNLRDGQVVHPEGLMIYDEPDPYLVVAADKGTAAFSDVANEIAAEYHYWLGDAFASGGSHGYDHKAEGITARGAWECVRRHFRELGVDIFQDTFTVIGIGDMSGDVFGNGMLYTEKIKLQAAFNHLHIFLDPDPDPPSSYQERQRLFELPRSSWRDYRPDLISEGGGVFERSAKSIPLSPQVKAMLGVEEEALSGQDLIRAILRMPVDLLWNGGIGTYVKAGSERNADVGDASNDLVRIDACELHARVVGEGGNLGLTQLARIEYARAGGRINTDAVDNSGGVDMSDHEVNLKVLLQPLLSSGELNLVQRNRLLRDMTDEVSALVLRDNYSQSLALSLAEKRSCEDPLLFYSLLEYLAERGGLDPKVEFLPNHRQILERRRAGVGLTRPELAVLMAYVKMGLYQRLLGTDFPDEPHFQHYLFAYFPRVLRQRFPKAIAAHPLRREIIATQFTNTVVDVLGITFVHRVIRDTGATPVEVIRAALVALEVLDVQSFLERLFALDEIISSEAQYGALHEIVTALEGLVQWILLDDQDIGEVASFVNTYLEPLRKLRKGLREYLPGSERRRYRRAFKQALRQGFPEELAADIAGFDYLPSSIGIVEASRTSGVALEEAARRFYALGQRLSLGWLRDGLSRPRGENKWEKIALDSLIMELRRVQRDLSCHYLSARRKDKTLTPEAFLRRYPHFLQRYDQTLGEIKAEGALGLASGGVLARLLQLAAVKPPPEQPPDSNA